MAIIDKLVEFCSATTCAGTTAEAALGSTIDWLATYGPGGGSKPLYLMIHFDVAGSTTGTAFTINLYTDANGTLPAGGVLVGSWTFANSKMAAAVWSKATIAAGTAKDFYFPIGDAVSGRWLRYLGICEDSTGGTYGTKPVVTCALVTDPQSAPQ